MLLTLLRDAGGEGGYGTQIIEQVAPWMSLLMSLVHFIILIGIGQLMMRGVTKKMGGAMGNAMTFGKSNAKIYVESTTGIRFSDVAGEDEAKEILQDIVDFLHNPAKYSEIGASIPNGALLLVPPGSGNTLLAKPVPG